MKAFQLRDAEERKLSGEAEKSSVKRMGLLEGAEDEAEVQRKAFIKDKCVNKEYSQR